MDRIDEINTRLSAINAEIDAASGDQLTALETEVAELKAERSRIQAEAQTRQQLRANIAAGNISGEVIETRTQEETIMENNFTPASEEYRSAFLRHLRGEDMSEVEQRAFAFLTTNTTAPLPTVMQDRIIDLIGEAHPIVADVYTLHSHTAITIPVGKSIVADAGKTEEGADSNQLQITFDDVNLSGEDYTADIVLSYKMRNMAIPAFEDYLVTKISERLGAKLANGIVANIKTGIAEGNTINTGVSYATVCAGFGALKRVGTVIVYGTRETIFNKIVGMVDDKKHPIFQQPITAAAAGVILGAAIKYEDAMGAGELLIGDPKKYLQNVVAPVMIETDKVQGKPQLAYCGYTCQEGTLTDDKAFALVAEA